MTDFKEQNIRADTKRLANALGIPLARAEARLEALSTRMAKDPELFVAWEQVTLQLGDDAMVTDVYRSDGSDGSEAGTIVTTIVPVVPAVSQLPPKAAAQFMRHATDQMRRKVGEFELDNAFGRARSALPLLRRLGVR